MASLLGRFDMHTQRYEGHVFAPGQHPKPLGLVPLAGPDLARASRRVKRRAPGLDGVAAPRLEGLPE
eukprot:406384-Alexandrium_andersonii.AAC.1